MARSRNYPSGSGRQKIITRKEVKTRHQPAHWNTLPRLNDLSVHETLDLLINDEVNTKDFKGGWRRHLRSLFRELKRNFSDWHVDTFRRMICLLEHRHFRMDDHRTLTVVYNVSVHATAMLRRPELWLGKPGQQHHAQTLLGLVDHCFGLYPVPNFLRSVWLYRSKRQYQQWYIFAGIGGSLRELPEAPIPVTKKMAHQLRVLPGRVSIQYAFRFAQVKALGGSNELAWAVVRTTLGQGCNFHEEFWERVLIWMIKVNADPEQVSEVIDYLDAQYRNQQIDVSRRAWDTVVRDSNRWHQEFRNRRHWGYWSAEMEWEGMKLEPWRIAPESEQPNTVYEIIELCTGETLRLESSRMSHCVVTYGHRCMQGHSRIFSMRKHVNGKAELQPVLTIEVQPGNRQIVQVRGYANSRPGADLKLIIKQWANERHLKLSPFP